MRFPFPKDTKKKRAAEVHRPVIGDVLGLHVREEPIEHLVVGGQPPAHVRAPQGEEQLEKSRATCATVGSQRGSRL